MTRVFVNGVEVRKEDLENIEIKCEVLSRIISEKLASDEEQAS